MNQIRINLLKFILLVAAFQCELTLFAQEKNESSRYLIRTADKKEFIARIISQTDSTITFKIENGLGNSEVIFSRSFIVHREKVISGEIVNGKYWRPISNISYFFTPSGYSLRKGEWNIQNTWAAIYNQVNVGVTNNIQLGLGIVPSGMLWGNLRVTVPVVKDRLIVGANFIYGTYSFNNIFFENQSKIIVGFGFATIGSQNYNLTVGYGTISNGVGAQPIYTISGAARLSRSIMLVTENYIQHNDLHIVGMKIGQKQITLSAGIFLIKNYSARQLQLPWLGISFRFGRKC